ncbi:BlaI/MecI/CopY family transcriptional regulator [Erysipelothrix sp. D19-032]
MRVIWSLDEATRPRRFEVLKDTQNWEVATTKTLLGRLVKKGYLDTRKDGNRFIYLPLVTEEESVSNRVDKLFTSICNSGLLVVQSQKQSTPTTCQKKTEKLFSRLSKQKSLLILYPAVAYRIKQQNATVKLIIVNAVTIITNKKNTTDWELT